MTGRFLFIRDLQVAEDIGARAKLGWFDKEFNFWGTAYYRDGEEYYLISGSPDRIYDFAEERFCDNVYCTPVQTFTRKCPVPSGMEDYMAQDFKRMLGKQLQQKYPAEFLKEYHEIFCDIANDAAKKDLEQWQIMIDGLFDTEQLYLFELLLRQAYTAKNLKTETYDKFKRWLRDVYADMGDDLIVKDVYKRDFYSLRYWENGQQKLVINAQKLRLHVKVQELAAKGILTTPIYKKTYWYNHDYRLADARKDYETYLTNDLMQHFWETADKFNTLASSVSAEQYQKYSLMWLNRYGEDIKEYLEYYKIKWHCL